MATYVKVNEALYPAEISGYVTDRNWDNRESKTITMNGTYADVDALFQDNTPWYIVYEDKIPRLDEDGNIVDYDYQRTEYDNSEYCVRGDLTVHTPHKCSVKMGKPTATETAQAQAAEYLENLAALGVEV